MTDSLAWALERAQRYYGDRTAVVDGDLTWTYSELNSRVARLDGAFDELGLKRGDVVAVLAMNSAAHLVTWLAVPRSGRVLNDLNYRLAPAELEFILADSGASALIVDSAFLELGQRLAGAVPAVKHVIHVPEREQRPADGCMDFESMCTAGTAISAHPVEPDAVAGIFYTGGTTGLPKGAMLSHRNLVQNAKHILIATGYTDADTYLHSAPMFHLADGMSLFGLTWVGGRHVIQPAFEPGAWLRLVAEQRVTRAMLVPTMIGMLLEHPEIDEHDTSCLRGIFYGASPMPEAVLERAMRRFPCDWMQGYGMTEASPLLTLLTPEDHAAGANGDPSARARLRSAGRPVVGVEVEVRRADGVTVCDADEPGEVFARGPNIMLGYWNRDEETAAALVDGWYRSGDAARVDRDGYLYIVDRVKDMIISGGENVYCTEVENAIHRHDAVVECAVFGIPHPQWGEQVHASIVLKPGASVEAEEIIDHCRELIAGYKLPRSIEFRSELPKSGAGKILKKALREPYWEGLERRVS